MQAVKSVRIHGINESSLVSWCRNEWESSGHDPDPQYLARTFNISVMLEVYLHWNMQCCDTYRFVVGYLFLFFNNTL